MRVDFSEGVFSAISIEPVGSEVQRRMGCAFENKSVDHAFHVWRLCTCRKISLVSLSTLVFTSSTSLGLTF